MKKARSSKRKAIWSAAIIETLEARKLLSASWTALTNTAPGGIEAMTLLSNGDVLGQINGSASWALLTPSSTGSYTNGTWTRLSNAPDTRTYYSTELLENGNVFIAGGEYGTGGSNATIYNPVTNTWTPIPTSVGDFDDAASEILANGDVLDAVVYPATSGYTYLYNPTTNAWTTGPKLYRGSDADEQNWVKLADGSILMPDGKSTTERYIPASNSFVNDATDPVAQTDSLGEFGQGTLLPDGKAFYVGTGSTTEIYTPAYYNSSTGIYSPNGTTAMGTWTAGPTLPSTLGTDDAPIAQLDDGNVLFSIGPVDSYSSPTSFYIYNYSSNTIALSPGAPTETDPPYVNRFLDLPDGTVLMSVDGSTLYDYNDAGTAVAGAAPTITSIVANTSTGVYTLTGTQLNGNSEGAYFGDDAQENSNYPIVRLTSSGGTVYFARTFNWSSDGVDTGTTPITTNFTLPLGLPAGTYTVNAMVNGYISTSTTITTPTVADTAPTITTAATASPSPTGLTTTALSVSANGSSGLTYTWKNTSAPSGDPTASFSTNGTSTSNNVTATFQHAGAYTFVVTVTDADGLSTTSSVSVTVNQTLTSVTVTPGSPNLTAGQTQQLTATGYDQFGISMTSQPTFTWALNSGSGTVSTSGLYTTPTTGTLAVVTATTGSLVSTDSIYVVSSPWVSADIGSPGVVGSAFNTGGTFNVSGSGSDVWGTSDQFHYVYQTLGGNGFISAEVASEPNPLTTWEKAGVMIRQSLDASSQQAFMAITPGNGAAFQYRNTSGGSSANVNTGGPTAPYYVKLVRNGNTFSGYYSANGTTWTLESSTTIAMTGTMYIGLFIVSQSNTAASDVIFQNINLLDAQPVSLTVTGGTPASVNVLTNDTGPSGATLTLTGVGTPSKGTVTYNSSGGVTYNASSSVSGTDTFTYTMSDGLGDTATSTVTVNILGLQAYYPFAEGSGTTTADATGDGYTANISGGTWGTGIDSPYSLSLSGTSEYAYTPAMNLNTNTVTLTAWIKSSGTQTSSAGLIFERDGSNGQGLDFYNTTTLGYTWGTNASTYDYNSGLKPTAGTWTFVALVITASNATLYMEPFGGTMTSATQTISLPVEAYSGVIGLGEDPTYTTRDFSGLMDDVRIYNISLSSSQIAGVENLYPTIATAAAASPSPVTATTTALSVQGADYAGASVLTYTWAATNVPSGATTPVFSVNGTNAANDTTATFYQAGNYVFTVTVADQNGLSNTSNVSVTVNQTATSIAVTPASVSLASHGSQSFSAAENDQFGNALTSQPTFTWSSTGSGSINASTGAYTAGYYTGTATVTATAGSFTKNAAVTITNTAPVVTTAASASPASVSATTANLSVSATDDAGADMTYNWATTGTPPAPVVFSVNNTNTSSATTATFSKAGSYTFLVTIEDSGGLASNSSVVVTVNQTLTSVAVAPATTNLAENTTQTFIATGYDQFGNALTSQPGYAWSTISGIGSINASSGVCTSPAASGSAVIQAVSGSVSGSASITINDTAPTITTPASASPSPATGTTTNLSVSGSSDAGAGSLSYGWAATNVPSGATTPTFSVNNTNVSQNTTATFYLAGTYTFTVTLNDGQGQTTNSSVDVTVNQTLTSITVSPSSATLAESSTQPFSAGAFDQFGHALSPQPAFTWSKTAGIGSVNASSGVYTAPAATGTATVTATSGSVAGNAGVTVQYTGPSIATPASATPSPVSATTTALSVLGSEPAGESNLSYAWSATTIPDGATAPTYSVNSTNTAKNTTATFYEAGSYTFLVTVTDGQGGSATSSVNVTVNQTLTGVSLASNNIVAGNTTQATAVDQFSNAMAATPAWTATGGAINSSGLFTAGTAGGSFTITATISSNSVNTAVTVVPTTYSGSTGSDTYAIRVSPTDSTVEQIFVNTPESGVPTYSVPVSQLPSLTFTPASDGSVTLDFANGNPLPAGGINYSGGSSLFIEGSSGGGMAFTINGTQITDTAAASSPIFYSNLQSVEFDLSGGSNTLTQLAQPAAPSLIYNAGPGNNTLNVSGGSFTFNGDPALGSGSLTVNDNAAIVFSPPVAGTGYTARNLNALNLGSTATATVTASTTATDRTVLETNQLSIATGGTLDLGNNAMILHNGNLTAISNSIQSGYNNGSWTGKGITSSSARTDTTFLTALGVMLNNINGTAIDSTFDNQPVSPNDVLVKDTYYGDTNLDGEVDGSDYSRVDNAVLTGATGWFNGSFNYEGVVNGSDYTLIDNAFNVQGSQLPAQIPVPSVANPTAYYKFNDGVGTTTAADSTGNGYAGTIHGATVTDGVDASAGLSFNGTSNYVSLPALNLNSNTVTLSGWIETAGTQTNGAGLIFNRTGDAGNGLTIGANNHLGYSWGSSGATYNFNSNLVVQNDQWTFVALVVSPTNATLYMQPQGGELASATNSVANPAEPFNSETDIGRDSQGGKYFSGAMDEMRIYNTALTSSEVLTISDLAPTILTPAASTPSADISIQTALTVQAASLADGSALTYTWAATSAPIGATVSFTSNGTSSAYSTTATGTLPGTYTFTVTVTNTAGLSTTSSVNETFDIYPFDIAEINEPASPKGEGIVPWYLGNYVVNSRTPDDFNPNYGDPADHWVLVFDSLTIVAPDSQLDLGDNDMIIHNASASAAQQTLQTINGYVDAGYGLGGGANWTYPGIVSTLAADNGAGRSAITVMLNANPDGTPIYTTFDGQAVTATDVLVKYNG